jgi:valyl-tRNA synthetase
MHGDGSVHTSGWPEPLGIDADFAAGETAMAVVGALRKYKSGKQLPMNEPLAHVDVWGDVSGFEADISGVMHVEALNPLEERPEIESVVTGVDLDYSLVGPAFGSQVPDIEAAIEAEEYEVIDGALHAGGAELSSDMFEIEEERQYTGDGEMIEAGDAVVIVHREA